MQGGCRDRVKLAEVRAGAHLEAAAEADTWIKAVLMLETVTESRLRWMKYSFPCSKARDAFRIPTNDDVPRGRPIAT
jgi:hypothetical protein